MYIDIEDFQTGWYGIGIGLRPTEIDSIIEKLQMMKANPDQHFHIANDWKASRGVGDIEFYIKSPEQEDNASLSSEAILPQTIKANERKTV